MKFSSMFFCALISSISCFADTATIQPFSVANYQPPRFRTQSLTISPNINLNSNNQSDSSSGSGNQNTSSSQNGNVGFSTSHSFRNYAIMSDIELSTNAYFDGSSNSNFRSSSSQYYKNTNDPNFSYSINNTTRYRHYIPNGFFIEGAISPTIQNYMASKREDVTYTILMDGFDSLNTQLSNYQARKSTYESNSIWLNSMANVGVGKGWVVDVTGAAIALQMIDRISKINGVRPNLTNVQIDSLSRLLDHFRQKRVFDSRIAEIEAIDTICRFLVRESLLPNETARMAMEMNDIYQYGFNQSRFSGKEIKISPIAQIKYDRSSSHNSEYYQDSVGPYNQLLQPSDLASLPLKSSSKSDYYSSELFLSYGFEFSGKLSKLYGRNFELDAALGLTAVMNTLRDSSFSTSANYISPSSGLPDSVYSVNNAYYKVTFPHARMNASLDLKWYPSIRSTISLQNQLSYSEDFNFKSMVSNSYSSNTLMLAPGRLKALGFSSRLNAQYYISPRSSYTAWISASYASGWSRSYYFYNNDYPYYQWSQGSIHSWNFSVGASFSYAVF